MHLPAIFMAALAGLVLWGPLNLDPQLRSTLFIACITVFFLFLGCLIPHWIACHGRNIPDNILGRYFGVMFGVAGITGIAGGALAQHWIAQGGLDWGYSACFALAVPVELLSVVMLAATRPIGEAPTPAGVLRAYLAEQWQNIRYNKTFQIFGVLAALMQLTTASGMLYTSYLNTLGEANTVVGWTTAILHGGTVAGAIVLGNLSDSRGPRWALGVGFLVFLASLVWINAGLSLFASSGSFFGLGFFNASFPVVTTYLVLTLAPKGRQLVYTGLFNSLMAPWALAPIALGVLAERAGYSAAFLVSGLAASLALILLIKVSDFGEVLPA